MCVCGGRESLYPCLCLICWNYSSTFAAVCRYVVLCCVCVCVCVCVFSKVIPEAIYPEITANLGLLVLPHSYQETNPVCVCVCVRVCVCMALRLYVCVPNSRVSNNLTTMLRLSD